MNILQSLHGLIPAPVPCFGDFRICRYSFSSGFLLMSSVMIFVSFGSGSDLHVEQPNGRLNFRAVIWKDWSFSISIASLESSPPE